MTTKRTHGGPRSNSGGRRPGTGGLRTGAGAPPTAARLVVPLDGAAQADIERLAGLWGVSRGAALQIALSRIESAVSAVVHKAIADEWQRADEVFQRLSEEEA